VHIEDESYLDNDDQEIEDQSTEEADDDESDDPPQQKGNLGAALKQERERAKQLTEQLKEREKAYERQQALLEQLGQNRQPQQNNEDYNKVLQEKLFENPAHVLGYYAQQAQLNAIRQLAPQQKHIAKMHLSSNPEYAELYKMDAVREAVDAYIDQQLDQAGAVDFESLGQVMTYFSNMKAAFGGGAKPSTKGRENLSSAVNKGSQGRSASLSDEQALQEALKMPPKKYAEWEAKNKDLVNRVLKGQKL